MDAAARTDGRAAVSERLSIPRTLMLVSDRADAAVRTEVASDRRPRPEYLQLESAHNVELLDWSRFGRSGSKRTPQLSLRHVAAALPRIAQQDVVFSDGEHLGIPMAMAMRALGRTKPHVVLCHHLSTRRKKVFFSRLKAHEGISRLLFHASDQLDQARAYGIPDSKLALVPYFADAAFWRPLPLPEEKLVASAGREHRDYGCLAQALGGASVEVFVAAASAHSPSARWSVPESWPANFRAGAFGFEELRQLYARAAVVVIPLLPTDFQAGVTTLLEAMAMGKAVVVTANRAHRELVEDGVDAVLVNPGDPSAIRGAVERLLADPLERHRLGEAARARVLHEFDLEAYCDRLAAHFRAVAAAA